MEAAAEKTMTKRRQPGKNKVVVGAWGGGGGLLLLGGALAATAALGVAFIVRAATNKRKTRTKGSPHEAEQQERASNTTSSSEVGVDEGEEKGGLRSLLLPLRPPPPPPPQASPPSPPPLPQGENDSSSKHEQTPISQNPAAPSESGADDASATVNEDAIVKKSNFVQVQEKIIEESSSIRSGQEQGEEDLLPVIVNKDVVVDEIKIIKVVEEVPLEGLASADGSAWEEEEEEEGSPDEEGTEESSGETGDSSMGGADSAEVAWPAKATEPSLPSLVILDSKVQMSMTKEEVFHGDGEKVGVEEAETTWKENRGCVLDRMVAEMKGKGSSKNAQVFLLISTLLFTTVLAILVHHYSNKLLGSSHI